MLPLAVFGLGMQELLVILLILVILFGSRKIPELGRGLGEGIRGFRSAMRGEDAPPADPPRDEGSTKPTRGS